MDSVEFWKYELSARAVPEKINVFKSFFKTGEGEYGEGDKFIGLSVPDNRAVAKTKTACLYEELGEMLDSEIHEHRLSAFLCLVEKYKKARKTPEIRREIVDFFLANVRKANNWDLVDLSAPYILGSWIVENPYDEAILLRFAESDNLWEQRVAIVSTLMLIRHNRFRPTFVIADSYTNHPHHLIQKATGRMLREIGKRDEKLLLSYLETKAAYMPRITLSYTIERLSPTLKQHFRAMKRDFDK